MNKSFISIITSFFSLTLVFAADGTNPLASPVVRIILILVLALVSIFGYRNMQKHRKGSVGISSNSAFASTFSDHVSEFSLSDSDKPRYESYKQYVKTYKGQYSDDQLRKALSDQGVASAWIDQIFKEV